MSQPSRLLYVSLRFFGLSVGALVFATALYLLDAVLQKTILSYGGAIILILGIPFFVGGLVSLLSDLRGERSFRFYFSVSGGVMFAVFLVGGILMREGVVCLILIGPWWIGMSVLGGGLIGMWHKQFTEKYRVSCSVLVLAPFLLIFVDYLMPYKTQEFTVTREIVLQATPGDIWPHLLEMRDIRPEEGRWTFVQDVMQVPRPVSAVVNGKGAGSTRHAQWGEHITFEEKIFDWQSNERLVWNFHFPNDSISLHTDRHISPDGDFLKIGEGGYQLVPLPNGKTKLKLHTTYSATTPVNSYFRIWGEISLGGIQKNILKTIETRVG